MIEHKTVSLADQIFEHLETDILSGKYQRGDILTESKLSAELGVSRTPIREALRQLTHDHIIEETSKGLRVLGISKKDLEDIFTIRIHLEGVAVKLAAARITDAQIEQLRETLELQDFYLNKHDSERIRLMDSQFHRLIYRFSGSTTFYDVLVPLHKKTQKYRKASIEQGERAAVSVKEHWGVFEAIADRNGELAEELMINHAKLAYEHMLESLKGSD